MSGTGDRRRTVFLAVLVLVLLGCEANEGPGRIERGPPTATQAERGETPGDLGRPGRRAVPRGGDATRVLVTSSDPSLPEGCRPGEVAGLVLDFFDAFNAGDEERLSRLFFVSEGPSPPDFSPEGYYPWSWYLVSETGADGRIDDGFVTYDGAELLDYFARRHERGERLELLKVGVTGPGLLGEDGNVGVVYVLTRTADDLRAELGGPDRVAFGKGAINCGRRQIFAFSIEMRAGERRSAREAAGWLCEDPPGFRVGESVVACA